MTNNKVKDKHQKQPFWLCQKRREKNVDEDSKNIEEIRENIVDAGSLNTNGGSKSIDMDIEADGLDERGLEHDDTGNDSIGDSNPVGSTKDGNGKEEEDALFDIDTFNINNKTPYEKLFYRPLHVFLAPLFKHKLETIFLVPEKVGTNLVTN